MLVTRAVYACDCIDIITFINKVKRNGESLDYFETGLIRSISSLGLVPGLQAYTLASVLQILISLPDLVVSCEHSFSK